MKKWILIGVGVLAAGVAAMSIFGKPHVIDVTKGYEGKGYFGRRFETKVDLIVFQFSDSDELSLSAPGADMPRLEELPKAFPYRWYGDKIYGVLPRGSAFKLVGAHQSTSSTMGHSWFMGEIESDGPFKGKIVGTSLISNYADGRLYELKYAVELTTSTVK